MSPTWLYWPAAGGGTPWAPSDLADLRCWLDASDASTITLSGSSITLWEDKAGSNDADDAVNASNVKITTKRPTIATAEQNGLDAVAFSGSQWFDHNTAKGMLTNRSCALIAVAMKTGSFSNTFQFAWINGNATGINRMALGTTDNTEFRLLSRREDADSTTASVVSTSNTNWHILSGVLDWTNGDLEFFIDGTSVGTSSYQSSGNTENTDLNTTATTRTAIGAIDRDGGNELPSGSRIGEMICVAKNSGTISDADREKVEGYLAHKWGLTANLPPGHPYKTSAPTVSPLWTPSNLSSLRAWYKADAISGLSDADPVSTWSDSSGNSQDVTATSTERPIYKTSIQNSLPVVRFDGSNDRLKKTTSPITGTTARTIAVVAKADVVDSAGIIGMGVEATGISTGSGFDITPEVAIRVLGSRTFTVGFGTTSFRVLVVSCPASPTVTDVDGWLDGEALTQNTTTGTTLNTSGDLFIGERGQASIPSNFDGDVAEVVMCDAQLSQSDREKLEGYLAHKWGLEGNLPVDHPYKNSPPEAP